MLQHLSQQKDTCMSLIADGGNKMIFVHPPQFIMNNCSRLMHVTEHIPEKAISTTICIIVAIQGNT